MLSNDHNLMCNNGFDVIKAGTEWTYSSWSQPLLFSHVKLKIEPSYETYNFLSFFHANQQQVSKMTSLILRFMTNFKDVRKMTYNKHTQCCSGLQTT